MSYPQLIQVPQQNPQNVIVPAQTNNPNQQGNVYYLYPSQVQQQIPQVQQPQNVEVTIPTPTKKSDKTSLQRKGSLILFIVGFFFPLTWVVLVLAKFFSRDHFSRFLATYSLCGILLYAILLICYILLL
ncbi:hypothetical protein QTN25_005183 [Entamoeba marina]